MRDSGVAPLGVGSSGVLLFFATGRQSCRSAGVLVLKVLFFGALVLDVVFPDVSIVVVTFVFAVVDVLVAKVMKSRFFWRALFLGLWGLRTDPPLLCRRDVAILARSLDWRVGWQAGSGDSRLEYR